MRISLRITHEELLRIIQEHIQKKFASSELTPGDITIYVKSKQNYKASWEPADVMVVNAEAREEYNQLMVGRDIQKLPVIEATVEVS